MEASIEEEIEEGKELSDTPTFKDVNKNFVRKKEGCPRIPKVGYGNG